MPVSMVTINGILNFLLNHKLHILGQENGSHILYTICYYSRIPVSMVTINEILNFLVNNKLHILGQENRSHILYTICYYSRIPMSMVTINTEHTMSRKWQQHFVQYMLLQ